MAGAISSAVYFNSLAGTPSGPEALCGLRFLRSLVIPGTRMWMLSSSKDEDWDEDWVQGLEEM